MKRLILTLALGATLIAPAHAAGVTVTLSVGPTSYTTTITTANAQRLATWAAGAYPTIPNPDCVPNPTTCSPATLSNPTPGVSALAAIWQGIVNNIQSSETATAEKTIAPPAPVN